MKYINVVVFVFFMVLNACCSDDSDQEAAVLSEVDGGVFTYQSSNEIFSNPERGFMHTRPIFSEGAPLEMAFLNNMREDNNISIILRLYYLEKFKDTAMSEAQLDLIKTDFIRFREAGIKCILRFAYTNNLDDGKDAPYEIVEKHLDQLKPIFEENADIIAFVQAGFIGPWGEWHSSSNGLNRFAIVNKLLEVLPSGIKIQLRTPLYKQQIFGRSSMNSDVGYGTTAIARVGFHNDCFLSDFTDRGTYTTNIDAEKLYISEEAFFVPTGGETCPPNGVPIASCNIAAAEMALLKWTYLNLDYDTDVLYFWRRYACFDRFQRELGYRLSLQSSKLEAEVASNGIFELSVGIKNIGFAPVYNPKNTFLVFRSVADGTLYKKELSFDVRHIGPQGLYPLVEDISISGIPVGDYELLLKIEDIAERLKDRPEYSIRLANQGVWEEETGFNKLLHTLTIK